VFYGIPSDRIEKFKQALDYIRETYNGSVFASDMLIAIEKNLTFRKDRKFADSFRASIETEQEHSLAWRLHVLTWAASHALHIEGDFVECGVFRGFSSAVICKYLDFESLPQQFYLYDTFSGLAAETSTVEEREKWSEYEDFDPDRLLEHVNQVFSVYPNVKIVKGIVPHSFTEAVPEKIAYLHLDMNSSIAEIMALQELFPRMTKGAILVLDDFGWLANKNQSIAELEFMHEFKHKVLELPTGQGLVIKH